MTEFNVPAPTGGDDRGMIQAQIDAAMQAGGGTVRLAEGTYKVGAVKYHFKGGKEEYDALIVPSHVTLVGAGQDKTSLVYAGAENVTAVVRTPKGGNHIDAQGGLRKDLPFGVENVVFSGFAVDGAGKAKSGIYVGQTPAQNDDTSTLNAVAGLIENGRADRNITITNVTATGAWHAGLNIHELTSNLVMRDVTSHGNSGADADGIILDGVHRAELTNVRVHGNGRHGMNVVSGSRAITIQGLVTTDNAQNGLVVQTPDGFPTQTGDVRVNGLEASGNGKKSVHVKNADNVSVNGKRVAEVSADMQRALAQAADPNYVVARGADAVAQAGLPDISRDAGVRSV